eukprot:gene1571-1910_t
MAQQYDELEAAKKHLYVSAGDGWVGSSSSSRAVQFLVDAISATAAPSAGESAGSQAVFDAPAPSEDIYANPPSLLSTLQNQLQSDINDPALREAKIGPGQLGLAGGAVLLGLVFVLVSGGDFATTNRYKGLRPARPPPDPIEMSRLATQAERFEAKYNDNSNDLETVAHPDDSEAWRLLGESRLLNADAANSVSAYQQAIALAPNDQQIITDALAAYDTLIGAFPSDFRGYLAKGIFLRDRGRQGDAERMFLQAKFYAPENLQSFIASRAGARPDVGPLPDNGLE